MRCLQDWDILPRICNAFTFHLSAFLSSARPTYIPSVPSCLDPKRSWSCSLPLPRTSAWRWSRVPSAPGDAWRGRHPADASPRGSAEIPLYAPSPRFLLFTTDLVEGGHVIKSVCGPNARCASEVEDGTRGVRVIWVWSLGADRQTFYMVIAIPRQGRVAERE